MSDGLPQPGGGEVYVRWGVEADASLGRVVCSLPISDLRAVLSRLDAVEAERDEARENYAFMVRKAADAECPKCGTGRLAAYREQGSALASVTQELAEARADVDARLAERDRLWREYAKAIRRYERRPLMTDETEEAVYGLIDAEDAARAALIADGAKVDG